MNTAGQKGEQDKPGSQQNVWPFHITWSPAGTSLLQTTNQDFYSLSSCLLSPVTWLIINNLRPTHIFWSGQACFYDSFWHPGLYIVIVWVSYCDFLCGSIKLVALSGIFITLLLIEETDNTGTVTQLNPCEGHNSMICIHLWFSTRTERLNGLGFIVELFLPCIGSLKRFC